MRLAMKKPFLFAVGGALLALLPIALLALAGVIVIPATTSEKELAMAKLNDAAVTGGYSVSMAQFDALKWQIGGGHRLERFGLNESGGVFGRLSSGKPLDAATWDWASQGLSAQFPVEFNNRTNGQKIEIGVIARTSQSNPSATLSVVYATQQAGNSGWKDLVLDTDFSLKTIVFQVPRVQPGAYTKQPIVVLNADRSGSGKSVEILGVFVKPVVP